MNSDVLPSVLTQVAYVVLALLAAFGIAHALSIVTSAFRPPWRRWNADSNAVAAELGNQTVRMKGLVWDIANPSSGGNSEATAPYTRQQLASFRSKGPKRGLVPWLVRWKPDIDAPLKAALEEAERNEWEDTAAAVDEALVADHSRWQGRLGVLIAAGPPAGAAPTMSGAMSFLAAYTDKAQEGITTPPIGAIRDALLTTYVGCGICVAGIVLLAVVSSFYQRGRPSLVRAVDEILISYQLWLEVAHEAQAIVEEAEVPDHG